MKAKISLVCGFALVATMLTADAPAPAIGRYTLTLAPMAISTSSGRTLRVDTAWRLDTMTGQTCFTFLIQPTNSDVVAVWTEVRGPVQSNHQATQAIDDLTQWLITNNVSKSQ